jgi:small-conductance mechanosensitive channel
MWSDLLRWLGDTARGSAGRLVGVAIVLIAVLLLARWGRRAVSRSIADTNARYRARKMIGVAGVVVAVLVVGIAFSTSLTGLSVVLGVTAAGVALALQDLIASIAGWLMITSGSAFHAGDRIELAGIKGDVIDIGVLRTTLMEIGQWVGSDLYNGRIVKIANSAVFKQPVFNYTAHFPFLWDEVKVPVQYGSDRVRARAILEDAAAEVCGAYARQAATSWSKMVRRYLIENASVEPMVSLVATDNWLEYTVRYPVDAKWRRTTRDRLFTRILDSIDATSGAVTIASSTVQILPAPPPRPAAGDGAAHHGAAHP